MVVFESVNAQVLVGTKLALEYPDPVGTKKRSINRYVEVMAGTSFKVNVQCGSQVFERAEGLICTLTVDGRAVDRVLLRNMKGNSCVVFDTYRGVIPSEFEDVRCDYLFAEAANCEPHVLISEIED